MNTHTPSLIRSLVVASLALALGAGAQAQQTRNAEDPQIARAKQQYDYGSWKQGPRRAGLDWRSVRFDGRVAEAYKLLPSDRLVRSYRSEAGASKVQLEVKVFDKAREAHEDLVESIAFVSSTKSLPTTAAEGFAIGDRGYVGYSGAAPGAISWIAWVDGNVSLRLCCHDPRKPLERPLSAMAEEVSALVRRGPELALEAPARAPRIETLRADRPRCKAGEEIALGVDVVDPLGTPCHQQWQIAGGALGYVEQDGDSWILSTTGPGTLELTLRVVGRYGVVASKTLRLLVDEED